MAPNREMDVVAIPTQRPLNGAAARQDEVVVTWNTGCWADWQLPILVVLFAGLGVLAVIFVVNINNTNVVVRLLYNPSMFFASQLLNYKTEMMFIIGYIYCYQKYN
jgi:hypothetical protein